MEFLSVRSLILTRVKDETWKRFDAFYLRNIRLRESAVADNDPVELMYSSIAHIAPRTGDHSKTRILLSIIRYSEFLFFFSREVFSESNAQHKCFEVDVLVQAFLFGVVFNYLAEVFAVHELWVG